MDEYVVEIECTAFARLNMRVKAGEQPSEEAARKAAVEWAKGSPARWLEGGRLRSLSQQMDISVVTVTKHGGKD